jgi:hypothetical protein
VTVQVLANVFGDCVARNNHLIFYSGHVILMRMRLVSPGAIPKKAMPHRATELRESFCGNACCSPDDDARACCWLRHQRDVSVVSKLDENYN